MACSILNIKLKERVEVIKIKEIISRGERFIIARDQRGKEHKILRIDLFLSGSGWHSISVGSEIAVYIRESVQKVKILSIKEPIVSLVWDDIPIPGFLWICRICKKRGVVSWEEGISASASIREIYANHENLSPKCSPDKISIYDHNFIEQKEIAKIIAFKKKQ